jgi:hypothetical protein
MALFHPFLSHGFALDAILFEFIAQSDLDRSEAPRKRAKEKGEKRHGSAHRTAGG